MDTSFFGVDRCSPARSWTPPEPTKRERLASFVSGVLKGLNLFDADAFPRNPMKPWLIDFGPGKRDL